MYILEDFSKSSISKLRKYLQKYQLLELEIGCGIPAYNSKNIFPTSLQSLLDQVLPSLFFISEDKSSQTSYLESIKVDFQEAKNLIFYKSPRRIGQLENTKLVREFFINVVPEINYYFLASDHDLWHSTFTKDLYKSLKLYPKSVMAFPKTISISGNRELSGEKWRELLDFLEIQSESDNTRRRNIYSYRKIRTTSQSKEVAENLPSKLLFIKNKMSAGNMIYGLENLSLSKSVPYYEKTLGPDRLFLTKLLNKGSFVTVDKELWLRIQFSSHSKDRQISNLFPRQQPPLKLLTRFPDFHHAFMISRDISLTKRFRLFVPLCLIGKVLQDKFRKSIFHNFRKFVKLVLRTRRKARKGVFSLMRRMFRFFLKVKRILRKILYWLLYKSIRKYFHFSIKLIRRFVVKLMIVMRKKPQ